MDISGIQNRLLNIRDRLSMLQSEVQLLIGDMDPAPGWTSHRIGDPMPVAGGDVVEVQLRAGRVAREKACDIDWSDRFSPSPGDVMRWRAAP